jgi:hypothetical protein
MCHICRTQNVFPLGAVCAALWTYSEVDAHALSEGMLSKLLIFVGKMPIGKSPIGKTPVGVRY